ncbi:hypothetical protein DFH09DRAFT_1134619 [Mycena vulgaris]|nr:hypothetical protein DFH09DRAFT_1134619 [Mycena vulgaris]
MDLQSPTKRPRNEVEDAVVRKSRIWYSDGSVILQAEAMQFRVHASLLSAGSTVFKDMFEIARGPANSDSQVDGCPLVHLFDDKARDVELALDALCDRNFYKTREKEFDQVAAMWRIGKKYGFEELQDDARRRLKHLFPSTLSDFQARYYPSPPTSGESPRSASQIATYPGLIYDAINLARSTGLLSILPAALYCACAYSPNLRTVHEHILFGMRRHNGVRVHLSDADKALCILASSDLLERQWEGPYRWAHGRDTASKCSLWQTCDWTRNAVKRSLGVPVHILVALDPMISGGPTLVLCDTCEALSHATFFTGQQKFWNDLPSVFGLPSWDDIKSEMSRHSPPPT